MPLQATSGAASYDAFGGGVAAVPNYIEDVFSTWLYTGNGSTQTITNGIDLAGKGGLVWTKNRTSTTNPIFNHRLYDSARGINYALRSNSTASSDLLSVFSSWNADGFSLGGSNPSASNNNGDPYASWTFREQAKFFDVVTYTGNSTFDRAISHNLGSAPGFVVIKRTDTTSNWIAQHRSNSQKNEKILYLNDTSAYANEGDSYFSRADCLTSTSVFVGNNAEVNATGGTYVMYLWAHNAGGFGLTGTDNVISCGSFTTNGSGAASVNLGYEPQWILCKPSSSTGDWFIADNMRGFSLTSTATLYPNSSGAENSLITFNASFPLNPTATGFETPNALLPSRTYIYIAIRRGPMKVPTTGTSVFSPVAYTGTGTNSRSISTTVRPDALFWAATNRNAYDSNYMFDRLRGVLDSGSASLRTNVNNAEGSVGFELSAFNNTTVVFGTASSSGFDSTSVNGLMYNFTRAPGFFDEVCYTGTGSATTQTHNLGVAPEMMWVKRRDSAGGWTVYFGSGTEYLVINSTAAKVTGNTNRWNSTVPTSSVFSVGNSFEINASAGTYVAYLFASATRVSKIGTYTGTGSTLQINCGFTGGARFVLIKRTDNTGDWYVWDTARGIVSGDDPYIMINNTDVEVTNTDYIDTASTGFEISSTAPAAINASGGTFLFLAIA